MVTNVKSLLLGSVLIKYCHFDINNIIVLSGVKLSPFVQPPTHNDYNNIYTQIHTRDTLSGPKYFNVYMMRGG